MGGPVVAQIQAVLLADRFIETGATFDFALLFPELPATGVSAAQLLPSGPGGPPRGLTTLNTRPRFHEPAVKLRTCHALYEERGWSAKGAQTSQPRATPWVEDREAPKP